MTDPHDAITRLRDKLKDIENHCPCGARPESPRTHPHVLTCPVEEAIRLADELDTVIAASREKEQEDFARVDVHR